MLIPQAPSLMFHLLALTKLQSPSCAATLAGTDVAVFMFDSTSLASFRTAHQLMLAVAQAAGDALPCVFLAAKDDLGMSQVPFWFRRFLIISGKIWRRRRQLATRSLASSWHPKTT